MMIILGAALYEYIFFKFTLTTWNGYESAYF